MPPSCYLLEKSATGQQFYSLFFAYPRREQIKALLTNLLVSNDDEGFREGQVEQHFSEETTDLWIVESGRVTRRIDLTPLITQDTDGTVHIDWTAYANLVPETLEGAPLTPGQAVELTDPETDLAGTGSGLLSLGAQPVRYGMQVHTDDGMSYEELYFYLTDPALTGEGPGPALIGRDDFLPFVDRALDGMARIIADLGDELANRRPPLPNANTPFQIYAHCLGVLEYWGGRMIAGRHVARDRDAEFTASGRVWDLLEEADKAKQRFRADVAEIRPDEPVHETPPTDWSPVPAGMTQGAALVHVLEELAQHHGQLEITRDLLRTAGSGE